VLIKKVFMLSPQNNMSWRFVIDLALSTERDFEAKIGLKNALTNNSKKASQTAEKSSDSGWFSSSSSTSKPSKARKKIVVLDPGHGGKDPGAIGAYGKTYEKNITLAMGKELKAVLEKQGYTVYLTRSTDIFIPLRQRVKIGQKHKADLFMSLHADSAANRNAKGLSVYTLSETASDKEAAALAERENKADIIGGMDFSENSREINDILISLSQTDSRNKSSKFAGYIVNEMKQSVKLVDNTHRFAGFAVLKAPDIPSALLEMGYLSNKEEESQLKQSSYRQKLANSVARAINRYFNDPEVAALF
jgi:N-acetylmuramoyl-L-alanine amidase